MAPSTEKHKERLSFISSSLENGMSREEIAALLGYKTWRSLDIFMRRTGAAWDSSTNSYKRRVNDHSQEFLQAEADPKAVSIISAFTKKDPDPIEIAKKHGFTNHRELSVHMAANGYRWSPETNNYVKVQPKPASDVEASMNSTRETIESLDDEGLKKYLPLLEALYKHKEKLLEFLLLGPAPGTIPRYAVPGMTRTKSFYISDRISRLISDFSNASNLSQKEVIEAAVIEFLRNHNYRSQVDAVLGERFQQ